MFNRRKLLLEYELLHNFISIHVDVIFIDVKINLFHCHCHCHYTDSPIGPLSYRHSSGVVRNPHLALAESGIFNLRSISPQGTHLLIARRRITIDQNITWTQHI